MAGAAAHHVPGRESGNLLMGNTCLLINTMAMAVYYILAKQAVQRYPAISVASWAYLVGERGGRRRAWHQGGGWAPRQRLPAAMPRCCWLSSLLSADWNPHAPPKTAATCMGIAALLFTGEADWAFPAVLVGPLVSRQVAAQTSAPGRAGRACNRP